MQILKADTQVKVLIGPFVDAADGVTPETGITLGAADQAEILKHDAASVTDISGSTWAAMTGCDGWYNLTLTTGNTDTEGMLTVVVQDSSVCLPVFARFMVVNANVYDSLYAAAAADYLQVDAVQLSGDATAADNAELDYDGTGYAKANSSVGSVSGAVGSVTGAVGSVTGNVGGNVVGSVASVTGAVGSVTAGVTVTTNNDKTGYGLSAAAVQAIWDALTSALTTVGSIGKKLADWVVGTIDTYTGNTKQTGDSFARLGAPAGASVSADIAAIEAQTDDIGAAGAGLTAVPWNAAWDAEVQSECTDSLNAYDPPTRAEATTDKEAIITEVNANETKIDTVDTVVDAIKAKTDNLPASPADDTSIDIQLGAIQTDVTAVKGYVDTEVAAVLAAVDTEVAAIKAKTDNLPAAPADDTSIDSQLAAIAGYLDTEVAAILAAVDTEVAAIKAKTDNLPAAPADDTSIDTQLGVLQTDVTAIKGYVDTEVAAVLAAVDTEVAAVKAVTDKLDTAMELDGAVYRYTTNALEQAPSGGATVAQIADGVWDEAAADHAAAGSMGKKLNDVTGGSPVNIEHDSTVIVTGS